MKIVAIGFANFRSIGSKPVILDLQKRINVLVGANNSGKSNVLEIMRRLKPEHLEQIKLPEVDLHQRDGTRLLELIIDVEASDPLEVPGGIRRFHVAVSAGISRWVVTPFDGLDHQQFEPFMLKWVQRRWGYGPSEAELKQQTQESGVAAFRRLHDLVPEIHVIPQFRRISSGTYAYLTPECVAAVYNEMTSSQRDFTLGTYQKIGGVLEKAYRPQWKTAFNYDSDKPAFARRIVANVAEMPERLDLRTRIDEMVQRIRVAN